MTANKARAPWHYWAVAGLLVLWNVVATVDYTLSVVLGDGYAEMSGMTAAQAAYFDTLPLWVTVAWTISVWAGAGAAVFYLLRRRFSAVLLALSLGGTLAYILHTYALSDGRAFMGDLWLMPAIVAAITAGLVGYVGVLKRGGIVC